MPRDHSNRGVACGGGGGGRAPPSLRWKGTGGTSTGDQLNVFHSY